MRALLVVSLTAGCWTSSSSTPAEPTPVAAESPAPRPVRMKPRDAPPPGGEAIIVRVLNLSVTNNVITVGLNGGQNQGIEPSWHAEILDGQTDLPLPGGELEILMVKPTVTVTRTQLTVQQIQQNSRVRLSPR